MRKWISLHPIVILESALQTGALIAIFIGYSWGYRGSNLVILALVGALVMFGTIVVLGCSQHRKTRKEKR